MKIKPMEERLSEEWGLVAKWRPESEQRQDAAEGRRVAEKIRDKIFEGNIEQAGLKDILTGEKLVACSYALGRLLADRRIGLKSAQLRRFYEALLNIKTLAINISRQLNATKLFEEKVRPEILMIKPQLANAKARQSREVTPFFEVINPLLDRVQTSEDYERLCKLAEAIVAYHKYCGGRD